MFAAGESVLYFFRFFRIWNKYRGDMYFGTVLGDGSAMFQPTKTGILEVRKNRIIFLSAGLAVPACAGSGVMQVLTNTLLQKNTTREMLGKVFALRSMAAYIVLPIGQVLTGAVLKYGYFAEAILVCGLVIFPVFIKYRGIENG